MILQWIRLQLSSYEITGFIVFGGGRWVHAQCVSAFYWNNTWISTLSTEGKTRDKKILVAWRRKRKMHEAQLCAWAAFYEQKKMAALGGRGSHYSKTCYKYRGRKTEIGTRQQNQHIPFTAYHFQHGKSELNAFKRLQQLKRAPTFHLI